MIKEIDKEESYFKNKILRFIFNSKENVPESICLLNVFIFDVLLFMLNIFIEIPEIVPGSLFYGSDIYNFGLSAVVLGLFLFTLLVSIIEIALFEYFIKK